MRFYVKLSVMIAVTAGAQCWVKANEQALDDAQFEARCFIGKLCGREITDEELLDAAIKLRSRQMTRIVHAHNRTVAARATTRPAGVRAASVADELEWSLACAGGASDPGR